MANKKYPGNVFFLIINIMYAGIITMLFLNFSQLLQYFNVGT